MHTQFNQVLPRTLILPLPQSLTQLPSKPLHAETQSSLSTWPNHRSLFRINASVVHSLPNCLLSSALAVPLFNCTPHIHLTHHSFRSLQSCHIFHILILPYLSLSWPKFHSHIPQTLWIQTLYTFSFTSREAPLDVSTGASSLNLTKVQSIHTLDAFMCLVHNNNNLKTSLQALLFLFSE